MRMPLTTCLALSLVACAPAGETGSPSSSVAANDYALAVADPQRPQADRDRDAARLPAEVLAFAQVDPGEKGGDFIMGGTIEVGGRYPITTDGGTIPQDGDSRHWEQEPALERIAGTSRDPAIHRVRTNVS